MKRLLLLSWVALHVVGCASPEFARVKPSGRFGFFDVQGELAEVSGSTREAAPIFAPLGHKQHESRSRPRITRAIVTQNSKSTAAVAAKPLPVGAGGLVWPLLSVSVTSDYGKRGSIFHEGVDLKAPIGTPVYAAQSGQVLYAGSKIRGYGRMVVLRHDNGIATVYAHNSQMFVKRGDRVIQGQRISLSGASGRTKGPHLHFETRRGVVALDPLRLLPLAPAKSVARRE